MSTHPPEADPVDTPPIDETMEEGEEGLDGYASSSPPSSEETSTLTWIAWFTSLPGHDYYCEVLEDFIEDDFNLTGLQSQVPFWKEALEMVLDVEPEEDSHTIPDISIIESSAELLYGLVHQRFILTKVGLQQMVEKYEQCNFGACPRVLCHSTPVLPCGRSDSPGLDTVKLYCPNCGDIYGPPSSRYANVDGAFFGTTFPMLFFQTYPEFLSMPFCSPPTDSTPGAPPTPTTSTGSIVPSTLGEESTDRLPSGDATNTVVNPNANGGQRYPHGGVYEPRIYGFKVSERARSGPRMTWLRQRPHTADELETVDWRGRFVDSDATGKEDPSAGPSGQGGGSGSGSGKLFDDEEEEKDEESEEEEEEDANAAKDDGAAAGQGIQRTVAATTMTITTATTATPDISLQLPLSKLLAPIPPASHHFLPTPASRRRRRNPAYSETETESELETPAEDATDRPLAWHERRKRVVVRRGKEVELAPKGKSVVSFGNLLQTVEDEMVEGVVAV